jgi:D-tagatose-1,6-bisphosphate aldolase subunit GatZ/KbaZ
MPGGRHDEGEIAITTPARVNETIRVFRTAFREKGLEQAWDRVVGMVVQPGVEFGDTRIHEYQPAAGLAEAILPYTGMVYEAHSTDYQTADALRHMTRHHFYILKVGPALTYALREGLYLLELMEKELNPPAPSNFRKTLIRHMKEDPDHWQQYYRGSVAEIEFKLNFSYSDRSRYYLECPEVVAARRQLLGNLITGIPHVLVSQYMPAQYTRLRSGQLGSHPRDLIVDRVADVLEKYFSAGD